MVQCSTCDVFSDVCAIETTCAVGGRWSATGDSWSCFCANPKGLTWILLLLCSSGYLPPNTQYVKHWLWCVWSFFITVRPGGKLFETPWHLIKVVSTMCLNQYGATGMTLIYILSHRMKLLCSLRRNFDSLKFYDISCFSMISFSCCCTWCKKEDYINVKTGISIFNMHHFYGFHIVAYVTVYTTVLVLNPQKKATFW